jgi:hypothetical protein
LLLPAHQSKARWSDDETHTKSKKELTRVRSQIQNGIGFCRFVIRIIRPECFWIFHSVWRFDALASRESSDFVRLSMSRIYELTLFWVSNSFKSAGKWQRRATQKGRPWTYWSHI